MNISEFCIRRPVFTILLMAALLVAGWSGYRSLSVDALPRVDFPTITVSANLPGANPETMAASVATPLERQFATISGVDSITSSSALGSTQITLQFKLDRDIDGAALDVQSAIAATTRRLPEEMREPPSFRKVNPAAMPVFFIAVSSDVLQPSQINEYADTLLAQRISTIKGVAQVSIYGEKKYAVRIQADPKLLAARDLTLAEVRSAISSAASNTPVGTISGDKQLYNIKITGQPNDANGFRPLIVAWRDGAPVRVQDVATVSDSIEDTRNIGRISGKNAVVLAVQRQPDANTIEVVKSVRALFPEFEKQLPPSVKLTPMFDRSVSISESVHDVQFTLQITIALVVLVMFLFLRRISATTIPAIAVPLSIIATYAGMAWLDFSINNVSLLALTLCVGYVVDDAVVMMENIVRHIEMGKKPFDAAIDGAKEIGFTIISITLSLIAVFIPVLFMGGIVGRLFREFAVTISLAILVSGLVSLTFTPMLCRFWLKAHDEEKEGRLSAWLERGFQNMLALYERTLKITLRHQRAMLLLTLLTLAGSVFGFANMPKGFFPLEDTGFIFGSVQAAPDISFDAMSVKMSQAEEIVKSDEAVDTVFYSFGGERGYNNARMFIALKPREGRDSAPQVINRIREKFSSVAGLNIFMQQVQNFQVGGRSSKSLYQYTLQGSNLQELYSWADKFEIALAKETGFVDVSSDLEMRSIELIIKLDEDKAASYGIGYDDVRQILYSAFGNAQVATLYTQSNDYAVILEVNDAAQRKPEDALNLYIRAANGTMIPLSAISDIVQSVGPLSVNHQGQMAAVTISYDVAKGFSLSEAAERIEAVKKKIGMPDTITGAAAGTAQAFKDSASGQGVLLIMTILVIYIILGMLYESFIHPITILSGLPSAGLGALIALWVFDYELSVIAIIGIVMLIGIVKKNAIMMVDFAIAAKKEGMNADDAIYQACLQRFRPIMMTTMAAIFGTLPIAIGYGAGAEFRQPLGIAVVGGLIVSQILTLYITPPVYLFFERLSLRFTPRFSRRAKV